MLTRTRMRMVLASGAGVVLASVLGGCVSQQHYDKLEMQYRTAADRNTALARQNEELQAALDLQRGAGSDTQSTLGELRSENERLRTQLMAANDMISEIDSRMREFDFMDSTTDRLLRDLAQKHPDVIVYDSRRGVLRFASDLTFGSGSDQLRQGAEETLAALAQVLNTQAGAQYELHIVGHTDSQAISSGTATRHPTNTHLSVHRAISVKQQLVAQGVPTERVMVAGWGETRPAVPNSADGNTPQNRRVEIYFRPDRNAAAVTESQGDELPPAEPEPLDPTK